MLDNKEIKMKLVYSYRSFLLMEVRSRRGQDWAFIIVYESPKSSIRRHLWKKLDVEVRHPWVLIGDFNCVLKVEERISNLGASNSLQSWVGRRRLIDLGFLGIQFTWSHRVCIQTDLIENYAAMSGGGRFP